MRRIIIIISLLFVLFATDIFCQERGEKVLKEVVINGQKMNKWIKVSTIEEYDSKGNLIHYNGGSEIWYEYDAKGNLIHEKWESGKEVWYEYDAKGNMIHQRSGEKNNYIKEIPHGVIIDANSYAPSEEEIWYDYNAEGNMIHQRNLEKGIVDRWHEYWYEYDAKGNMIHQRSGWKDIPESGHYYNEEEIRYEYDAKGNLIYQRSAKKNQITQEYYDQEEIRYEYDAKGNLIHDTTWPEHWYEYDSKGNLIYMRNNFGNGEKYVYEYEYWNGGILGFLKDKVIKKRITYYLE